MIVGDANYYLLALSVVWFFLYSFLGWAFEVVYTFAVDRTWVNRGFVVGPVCPIYGAGALLAILLLGGMRNPLAVGVVGALGATVMEYATSWTLEKLFHARWWDYSNLPFNLNGRVSLFSSTLFGIMMVVVNFVSQPLLVALLDPVPSAVIEALALALVLVFVVDLTSSVVHMNGLNLQLSLIQRYLSIVGSQALTRAEGAYNRARRTAEGMRDQVSGTMIAVGERARETAANVRDLSASAAESFLAWRTDEAAGVPPVQMGDVLAHLSELLPQRPSVFDRKSMRDPHFRSVDRTEAYDLLKAYFARNRDDARG